MNRPRIFNLRRHYGLVPQILYVHIFGATAAKKMMLSCNLTSVQWLPHRESTLTRKGCEIERLNIEAPGTFYRQNFDIDTGVRCTVLLHQSNNDAG